ncbi:hypothetical protein K402DRAFT_389822 [Aulographum hederae CBS 113979]|uniref:Uncharacterized protein n=1 Tax=Aulographum hederae CBS 113979 TaxID=1176131 RepID=A0A6G1HCI0_9PEZI|nr:hypothetical protein K402DRAFT_389822 [Aulographum hederae CBS 113979]
MVILVRAPSTCHVTLLTTNTNSKTYRGSTVHHRLRRALCQVIRECLSAISTSMS